MNRLNTILEQEDYECVTSAVWSIAEYYFSLNTSAEDIVSFIINMTQDSKDEILFLIKDRIWKTHPTRKFNDKEIRILEMIIKIIQAIWLDLEEQTQTSCPECEKDMRIQSTLLTICIIAYKRAMEYIR